MTPPTNNPSSFRLPFSLGEDVHPDVALGMRYAFSGLKDHTDSIAALAPKSGATAARPTKDILPGQQFYDSTMNKPIFWSGKAWVDSSGNTV